MSNCTCKQKHLPIEFYVGVKQTCMKQDEWNLKITLYWLYEY